LAVLREQVPDASVDLVYLDPPFNSGAVYSHFADVWTWGDRAAATYAEVQAQGPPALAGLLHGLRAVAGEGSLLAYLCMLAPRLVELRRTLRPTGSLYLHADGAASHSVKLMLDAVFGPACFRNEIVWHYGGRGAKAVARQFARNHDVIFLYSREAGAQVFHRQRTRRAYSEREARRRGFRQDEAGWYKTAPRGDYTDASICRLERAGRICRTRAGSVRVRYPLQSAAGLVYDEALVGDTWLDIPDGMHLGRERTGYPTQKPEALLGRIIRASSDEGALVLDPFCGSGTTLVAAERLRRRWTGIDCSPAAIETTQRRLTAAFGSAVQPYETLAEGERRA
jgi:site-specific DNA-methyltransferase (adenine-specific)